MVTISTKAKVGKNHKISLTVPATVPAGDYDMLVVLSNEPLDSNNILPISYASEKPDIKALAGIWKNKNITLEQLRKKAWGERL
jgi:hypothetical protein